MSTSSPSSSGPPPQQQPVKITVVGDGTVGKTCLLISYTTKTFPSDYVPTVFDNYSGEVLLDGTKHKVTLWDTAGQEEYSSLRQLSYKHTQIFLLCYAVNSDASFENIRLKWIPELRHCNPRTPILLVGTKTDLRDAAEQGNAAGGDSGKENGEAATVAPSGGGEGNRFVSTKEGHRMKGKVKANGFVECSARTGSGLQEVFEEAVRIALRESTKTTKRSCRIL
ncbi:unnamed protein product [Cyprideis torosa]|uniref:Uncharacterized protein n=1 Tax=Cyprideis torosa TaxID=163714 RepID=A0A7R8WPN3_9CRUS|nr:unnamed protein product [Cyprideis torosa]CAG0900967.1 unnamed protein product [Cyprideis torosa]